GDVPRRTGPLQVLLGGGEHVGHHLVGRGRYQPAEADRGDAAWRWKAGVDHRALRRAHVQARAQALVPVDVAAAQEGVDGHGRSRVAGVVGAVDRGVYLRVAALVIEEQILAALIEPHRYP